MKFSIKDFFSKYKQIRSFLRIWPHLLKKSLMENFIFCAVFRFKLTSENEHTECMERMECGLWFLSIWRLE